ncbi:alpha/beta fold hydrolase [Allorhodopirellula solitaria]|uniref:2-hydroxy-6-oxo-6-phenylhexa-2,4-dienoate hydrolase n=1 Tax=Allorhodopirellula solitaria TaxID=2527987 RepID=A0A5C5WLK9_9BACT|nr:alpha/beta hydrolase [Allorhodopirellula solitaria]TWT51560.1 2-hydroxy-6-oxo-6-phenylhexa-2,4-dienoate hydrolase [Allorhodopirellula solitaria]
MNWRSFQQLQKVVEIGDSFISYIDEGKGPPVVLIHGIPMWGYLWHQQIPALAETHRVLVPDLLGFGFSDKRDCFDRSISRQAEVIDQWMNALDIDQAVIVAHDIGGGVALRLATLFPHRVSKLCLLNTVCYDSWPIELMLQAGHPETKRKMSASTATNVLSHALKQGFSHSPDASVMEGLLAPYRTEVGKLSLIRNASALNTNLTTEITSRLPEIRVPALILWGEDDKFQLLKYGERLAWDIPSASLIRIENARHFVMLDQPDQVSRHLVDFLATPSESPRLEASPNGPSATVKR